MGIRRYQNPDGSYTDAGKKRYARQIETTNSFSRRIIPEKVSTEVSKKLRVHNDELQQLKKKRQEPYDMENKFWENSKLVDKYANKYADDLLKTYPASMYGRNDRDSLLNAIKYDDAGQNLYEEYYLKDHKSEAQRYNKVLEESVKARNDIKKIEKEIVDDLVGVYGNIEISHLPKYGTYKNGKLVVSQYYTVSDVLQDHMDDLIKDL